MVDLTEVLRQGSVPNLGTNREKIEYIDIDLIDDDPRNFYALSGLDELAANIELLGLQQPLRVRTNPDDRSRVIIVSGHRRRAASRKLVEEGKEQFRQIPCIRELDEASPALQELRLIYANSDTRKLSSADQSKQAERVEMLLYQLKEEGYEFPGRMRDHVAQACQISKSKLSRLKVIRYGLAEVWCGLWEKNKLPEQAAYALARLPGDFQRRLFKVTNGSVQGNSVERVLAKYEEGWRWEPTLTCPGGKACTNADAALRHDLDNYDMCGGAKCCLSCNQFNRSYSPCERACSKAKARRTEENAEKKASEEKEKARKQKKLQNEIAERARYLLVAADAAQIPDNTKITFSRYGGTFSIKQLRDIAEGEFGTYSPYSNDLAPSVLADVGKIAKALHCSADYILELSDELHPTAPPLQNCSAPAETLQECSGALALRHWRSSDPEEGQVAVVMYDFNERYGIPDYDLQIGEYKNGLWVEWGFDTLEIKDVVKWLPIGDPLTEDLPEESPWSEPYSDPEASGLYWCVTGLMNGGGRMMYWNNDERQWEHPGAAGCKMAVDVTLWMPCPDLPEGLSWCREVIDDGNRG